MSHVQRAAQNSRRDEVGDTHSTAEGKCVDVGYVGQRRLQEHSFDPVTGIGSCYSRNTLRSFAARKVYRNFAVGTLYRNIVVGTLYRNITVGIFY
jgi:hypothetical protein